jgi:hypothetical protein
MDDVTGAAISDRTLDALRTTAAMVRAVPGIGAQLRVGDDVILEVRRPPFPEGVSHRLMPVCRFHDAVAGAHRVRRAGEQVAMRGLPPSCEPSVDWGTAGEGRVLPSGIVRLARDGRWWHVVPVSAGRAEVDVVLGRGSPAVDRHTDDDLDVTILHTCTEAGDKRASARAVDALIDVLAAVGVRDLERRLGIPEPACTSSGPTAWVAGCPRCGHVDIDSIWPAAHLVSPRHWRCARCLSAGWEPTPVELPH